MTPALMLQGTSSHAGKSLLCAAFCRIFVQDGLRVMPFKAQNMSLNAAVTPGGGEIGRAQYAQALAARVVPEVDMNPILLKPKAELTSQVVVLGRPRGDMTWRTYRGRARAELLEVISASLARLQKACDVLVIEGAGSPAEVNLMDRDLANMTTARLAGARVLLVGDIDRGGVFASLLGTMEILPPHQRELVAGYLLNKFRGDVSLLGPATTWLAERTGRPTLGVIPYLPDPGVDEEDSVALEPQARHRPPAAGRLQLAVIRFPHISNFNDLDPLAREEDVVVHFVHSPAALTAVAGGEEPDAVILPGTKNTVDDLHSLYQTGLGRAIVALARRGVPVVGLCGGFQMLGQVLEDPGRVESSRKPPPPLGLLPVATVFASDKRTVQAQGTWLATPEEVPWATGLARSVLRGYEIHSGRVQWLAGARPLLSLARAGGGETVLDGAAVGSGQIWGTHLHGILENSLLRRRWLNYLRARRGWAPLPAPAAGGEDHDLLTDPVREQAFERLAEHVRAHVDLTAIYRLLGLEVG